jgi:bile acid:Na+ symporter, BASS family
VNDFLQLVFKFSLIIFMVGNLLAMGLQLRVSDAIVPLKSVRFVFATLIASFVFSPALAFAVTRVIPMERPYAIGILLLGLAPAAPFLPLAVKNAKGDLAAAAGLMLLASLGTIIVMPLGVPLIAPGMSASAWRIARPLLFLIFLPLAVGLGVKYRLPDTADWLYRYVKVITGVGTIVFLGVVLVLNFHGFIGAIGSRAFLAQLLFVPGLTVGGYWIGAGLPREQRSVMSLGICTRNIGAAAAIVGAGGDQRIMVMLVIATIATVAVSFGAAAWFARSARRSQLGAASERVVVAKA